MPCTYEVAHFEQPSLTKPPTLSPGKISPEILHLWVHSCQGYFQIKSVEGGEEVHMVLYGLQDPCIADWFTTNTVVLELLTFDAFVAEI